MVTAAVKCDRDERVYILVILNTVYVPSLDYNLLLVFMMREAGVIVKETLKIQWRDPS
jgi:cytochrome c oxidase subunit IV